MIKPNIHTSYLGRVYNVSEFAKIVEHAIMLAKQAMRETRYDTIAFTGTSGAAVSYILSNELAVPLLCVRKPNDGSHFQNGANGRLEGNIAASRYLIVDDFICGGNTIRDIQEEIKNHIPKAECVGFLLYDFHRSTRTEYKGLPVYTAKDTDMYSQRNLPFPYGFLP